MYNLPGKDGQRISDLVLNSQVITQIFLGEITSWNAPSIARINPNLAGDLPSTKIVPVYRADASGENYLLSDYLLHEDGSNFKAAQTAFHAGGILGAGNPSATWPTPTPGISYVKRTYPGWAAGYPVGQNGSSNAANDVSALSSKGSITYLDTLREGAQYAGGLVAECRWHCRSTNVSKRHNGSQGGSPQLRSHPEPDEGLFGHCSRRLSTIDLQLSHYCLLAEAGIDRT